MQLVARGFQEIEKLPSDSSIVVKESLKMLILLAANKDFDLASMNIRAAFLQRNKLDTDMFMKPLDYQRLEGWLWKLNKPLYGLDNASRKFWLKLEDTLMKLGLKIMPGDEAFYYLHEEGELKCAILTHVDDLILAGSTAFIEKIRAGIADELTLSKVEKDKFRFIGWDIEKFEDQIRVTMKDYARSIEEVTDIRKVIDHHDPLMKLELKQYRKNTGKLSWLAQET